MARNMLINLHVVLNGKWLLSNILLTKWDVSCQTNHVMINFDTLHHKMVFLKRLEDSYFFPISAIKNLRF